MPAASNVSRGADRGAPAETQVQGRFRGQALVRHAADLSDHPVLPFLGLRTVIYPATDLHAAKAEATALLGTDPYFDSDFYVGYSVAGFEFALDPHADPAAGPIAYWGVPDAEVAVQRPRH